MNKFRKVTYPGLDPDKYVVSSCGEVYNIGSLKKITPTIDKDGYLRIRCKQNDTSHFVTVFIHRLVAWEWCPKDRDIKLVVDHVDGNKQNNSYKNLEWVSIKENTRRAEALGLRNVRGSANGNSKYSEEFIHEICRLIADGKTNMDIMRILKSSKGPSNKFNREEYAFYQMIVRIRKKELWPDVTSQYEFPENIVAGKIFRPTENSTFNEKEIHEICKMLCVGKTADEIIDSISPVITKNERLRKRDIIYGIRTGTRWKSISSQYPLPKRRVIHDYSDLDEEVYQLANSGNSFDDVLKKMNISRENNRLMIRAIRRRYNNFMKLKNIKDGEDIESGRLFSNE